MVSVSTTDTISTPHKIPCCANDAEIVSVSVGTNAKVFNFPGNEVCLVCFVWVTPCSPEQMCSNGRFECKSQHEHLSSCLPWNLLNYLDLSESIQIKNTHKVSKRVTAILASSLAF